MTDHAVRYAAIAQESLQNAQDITAAIEKRCGSRYPEVYVGHPNVPTRLLKALALNCAVANAAKAISESVQLASQFGAQFGVDPAMVLDVLRFDEIAADARTLDDELDQLTNEDPQ